MRDDVTDACGELLTALYKQSGLDANGFMKEIEATFGALDLEPLSYVNVFNNKDLKEDFEASFFLVQDGGVLHCYYHQRRDQWFCKF